jgi:hypothetical protein
MTPMTLPSTERRAFIAALAGGLLGAPRAGWAQAAKATRVVGHLAGQLALSGEHAAPRRLPRGPARARLDRGADRGLRVPLGGGAVRPASPARHGAGPGSGGPHRGRSTSYPGVDRYRSALERVAAYRQHAIRFVEVRAPENLDRALATLRRLGVDGLVVMTDQVMQVRGDEVLE